MKFGYLIVVSTNKDHNYLNMAYALALSIKHTQPSGYNQVALVIDDSNALEDITSPWVFDHIIEWNQETFWNGRSWMDQLSPFENTICLDADMLFLRDHSDWVKSLIENVELYIPDKVYTYRNELVTSDYYRKAFVKNELPNLYSMYTFFKKDSELAKTFFALGRYIIKNPVEFSNIYLTEFKPSILGTDEAFGLSAKILGIDDIITYQAESIRIVHLKSMIQKWPYQLESWKNYIGFYLNLQGQLKIGNHFQSDIIHYVEKTAITQEMIRMLEELVWKN